MQHTRVNSITQIEPTASITRTVSARMRNNSCVVLALLIWCALASSASAQNIQYNQKSVDLGLRSDLKVNPSSRAVEMQIPLGSYEGRAGVNVPITILYSSKVWRVGYQGYNQGPLDTGGQPTGNGYVIASAQYAEHSRGGWTSSVGFPVIDNYSTSEGYNQFGNPSSGNCSSSGCFSVDRLLVRMQDGSTHELRSSDQPYDAANPPQLPNDLYAVDGSRLRYQRSTGTLFMPDGSRYNGSQYTDRNGNTLTANGNGLADTLGRNIPSIPLSVIAGDYPYALPGMNGTYTFEWRNLGDTGVLTSSQPLQYFAGSGCPPGTGTNNPHLFSSSLDTCIANASSVFNPVVLYRIVLPTGQAYKFTYNIYGEIDKVQLPTGGYERYEYAQILPISTMSVPYSQANRGITNRWVSASGLAADEVQWHYGDLGVSGTVTILAPDLTLTELYVHTDASLQGTFGYSQDGSRAGMSYDQRSYSAPDASGARTMLRRKLTEWSVTGSNATGLFPGAQQYANRNPRVTKEVEILLDTGGNALTKTTTYEYDTTYEFTVGVEPTLKKEYDYVTVDQNTAKNGAIGAIPVPNAPLRLTQTAYQTGDANYRSLNLLGLPNSVTVKDAAGATVSQTTISYDESTYPVLTYPLVTGWTNPGAGKRGNATTTSSWLNSTNTWLSTHTRFDQCGSRRVTWDAKGNQSQFDYTDSFNTGGSRNTYAYLTTSISPIPDPLGVTGSNASFATSSQYDFDTGLAVSATDVNGQTTSFGYNDPLNRLKTITRPTGGGSTSYEYGDTPNNLYVHVQTAMDATRSLDSYQYFDGLGRGVRSLSYDGNATSPWIAADTHYDQMGRVESASNPYRASSLSGATAACGECTTTEYDDLGRVKKVITPDGAQVVTDYGAMTTGTLGTTVTITDQAGKKRKSLTDSLGRLAKINEDPTDLNYQTSYGYDLLGNLLTVIQGAQTRTFVYDSLSRLASASNPESGTVGYQYDNNGNLQQKTDARGIITTYGYDSLNRMISRVYTNDPQQTPRVDYFYDGKGVSGQVANAAGRLTKVTSSVSSTLYTAFDAMGHVKSNSQVTDGQTYTFSNYEYDLAGNLKSETYPTGRIVNTSYDAAGRISQVAGQKTGETDKTYATSFSYAPHGAVAEMKLGNNLWEHTIFNNRLQPVLIGLGTSQSIPNPQDFNRFRVDYSYGTTTNNGNVLQQTISVPDTSGNYVAQMSQSYGYDELNRLKIAGEGNVLAPCRDQNNAVIACWQQTYLYDRYGNCTFDVSTDESGNKKTSDNALSSLLTIDPNNNRFTTGQGSILYDSAGNLTREFNGHTFGYDGENKQVTYDGGATMAGGASYYYDGDGKRVKKVTGVSMETTIFAYDAVGQMVAEYSSVTPQGPGGTSYLTSDTLGTPRIITHSSGAVKARRDYMPFGEEIGLLGGRTTGQGYVADNVRRKFTQKERDVESGLDYFHARYYSSAHGRFNSPDQPFADQWVSAPQSWNLYSYVLNTPLKFTDPNGRGHWELRDDGQEHYVGDKIGEFSKDLDAKWDGAKWNFRDIYGQENNIYPTVLISDPPRSRAADSAIKLLPGLAATAGGVGATAAIVNVVNGTLLFAGADAVVPGVVARDLQGNVIYQGDVDLQATYLRISQGFPDAHYNDGATYRNDNDFLPLRPEGYYTEWVVRTPGYGKVGPMRIVTGDGGEVWFTPDHYQKTFIPMNDAARNCGCGPGATGP